MADKIYPKGVRVFAPRQGAPSFVKGAVVITPNELIAWLRDNPDYLSDYKDQKQLRLDLLEGKDGLYVTVNTYKKEKEYSAKDDFPDVSGAANHIGKQDDLPF